MKVHGLPDGEEITVAAVYSASEPKYLITATYTSICNDDPRIVELQELAESMCPLTIEDEENSSKLDGQQFWIRGLYIRPTSFDQKRQVSFANLELTLELFSTEPL